MSIPILGSENFPAVITEKIMDLLGPDEYSSLQETNKTLNKQSKTNNIFQKTFGQIDQEELNQNSDILPTLIKARSQPDSKINHNPHKAPTSFIERWKWLTGADNSLNRQVQDQYERMINLLENSDATTIRQLKHQLQAFWHADRMVMDYGRFRATTKKQYLGGSFKSIRRLFFWAIGKLLRWKYGSETLRLKEKLENRSRTTHATIGEFNLDDKTYQVVAFHLLSDIRSRDYIGRYQKEPLLSKTDGRTVIGIISQEEADKKLNFSNFDTYSGKKHNFQATIARWRTENRPVKFMAEEHQHPVYGNLRALAIGNHLGYRDNAREAEGSDRKLDQKLTQIMIEMAKQNKDILRISVCSSNDELAVLTAAGFNSSGLKEIEIKNQLKLHRKNNDHTLFPPYKDYGGHDNHFSMDNSKIKNVRFQRDADQLESWDEIIGKAPILKPQAAILPEYWVKPPNFAEHVPELKEKESDSDSE